MIMVKDISSEPILYLDFFNLGIRLFNMKRRLYLISGIVLILLMSSCGISLMKSDNLEIVVKGGDFSIAWDDDSFNISNNTNRTTSYKVYFRVHGSSDWQLLDEIEAEKNPSYKISEEDLEYGIYDLGVSSVIGNGDESEIHSSLDMSADPFCGWYINWIGSK